ncbi:aldehyde dehydrogenase family protein [Dactylosporangium sp. CA-233914]|uniref:aldehyde dehydrogenase family protein n=1 Tax=Dactylosporangium sp. CA-233914 TaxID=3239934 RepID=UPI003D8CBF23
MSSVRDRTSNTSVIAGRINGNRVGGSTRRLHGPAGDVVAHVSLCGIEDVDTAVKAAADAQHAWRRTPAPRRGEVLSRAAALLVQRRAEFATTITLEEGKTLREAGAEVDRAVDYLSFFGAEGWRLAGQEFAGLEPNLTITSRREPLGVVGLITPWNFPLAIPAWKLGPALVAGNAVILKPALEAPGPGVLLAELLESAGLPAGVLNVLVGDGGTIGAAVVAHPGIDAISFTGSTQVGRQIAAAAGQRMARVQLELGGSNATVVLDDADPDAAAELIARSAFGLTGQACTATSRVYCTPGIASSLVAALVARARSLRLGDGTDPSADVGPLVSTTAHARVADIVDTAVREGAIRHTPRAAAPPFFEPTVLTNLPPGARILNTEVFGPVVAVVEVSCVEEAIACVNASPYGLVASILTDSLSAAQTFTDEVRAGTVKVNETTTGNQPNVPFGGLKDSSNAAFKEQGSVALDFYTVSKSVYLRW